MKPAMIRIVAVIIRMTCAVMRVRRMIVIVAGHKRSFSASVFSLSAANDHYFNAR
jgi:hypothetical protein